MADGRIVPAGSGWVQFEVTRLCPVEAPQLPKKHLEHAQGMIPLVVWVKPFIPITRPAINWRLCGGITHLVAPEDAINFTLERSARNDRFVCEHMGRFVE